MYIDPTLPARVFRLHTACMRRFRPPHCLQGEMFEASGMMVGTMPVA